MKQLFCERLISLRQESNLTQKDLADALFVSRSAVAKWEQGRGLPDAKIVCDIARYFDISIEKLIEDTELSEMYMPSSDNNDGIVKRIQLCLKNGDFSKAHDLVELLLNNNSANYQAYLLALLIDYKYTSLKELRESFKDISKNKNYIFALQFANEDERSNLIEISNQIKRNSERIKEQKCFDLGVLYFKQKKYEKAKAMFLLVPNFENSQEYYDKCETELLLIKDKQYIWATNVVRNKSSLSEVKKALKILSQLGDYRDSKELYKEAKQIVEKKKKKIAWGSVCSSLALVLIVLFSLLTPLVFVPNNKIYQRYVDAIALLDEGNYLKAKEEFQKLGDYKDSKKYVICSKIYLDIEEENYVNAKTRVFALENGKIGHNLYDMNNEKYDYVEFDGAPYVLPKPTTPFGMEFAKWEERNYLFNYKTEKLTLDSKATYNIATYTIYYKLCGGINNDLNIHHFTIYSDPITLYEPSKANNVFKGWYNNSGFTGNPIERIEPAEYGCDITLYAKFEPVVS